MRRYVIVTNTNSLGYITVEVSTDNLILQPSLDKATFFDDNDVAYFYLKRARESFETSKFRLAQLDSCLVPESKVFKGDVKAIMRKLLLLNLDL